MTVTNVCDMPDRKQSGLRNNRFDFVGFSASKGEVLLAVVSVKMETLMFCILFQQNKR
jgi:hypothetical protein